MIKIPEDIDIRTLPAGLEIDALVVENVMGYVKSDMPEDELESWLDNRAYLESERTIYYVHGDMVKTAGRDGIHLFPASDSLSHAWRAADKLADDHACEVGVQRSGIHRDEHYVAFVAVGDLTYDNPRLRVAVKGPTPALALCRVLLLVMSLQEEP